MASFVLVKEASSVLTNLTKQMQLRFSPSPCRYSFLVKNTNAHRPCMYQDCRVRGISNLHNPLHLEATLSLDQLKVQKNARSQNWNKSDPVLASMQFKNKTKLLGHLNRMVSKDEVLPIDQASAMLKSCGRRMIGETSSTRNELAKYVWDELGKNGVRLDTDMWNKLLMVYIENCHDFEPLDFLKDMWQESNAEPSERTFKLLVQACAVRGDPIGAKKMVEFMMKHGGKMTDYIYGCLVQAYAKSGDMEGVNAVLSSMRENNVQPKYTTYGQLINAYADRGDLERIDKTMKEMIKYNFYPTSSIFINLLEHLSIGGHTYLIDHVWERIDDNEYMIDDITPMVTRCVAREDYQSALILVKNSIKMKSEGSEHTYHRYIENRLFQILKFAEKDVKEFVKVSALMEHHLNQPPFSRVANVIDFFANTIDDIDTAFNHLKSLLSEGVPVTVQMVHPILKGYADKKHIPEIVKVYKFMIDNGIKLDYYCLKIVKPALGDPNSEEYQLFVELIMKTHNIVLPNGSLLEFVGLLRNADIFIEQIMTRLILDNHTKEALGFFKQMLEKDIPIPYSNVLRVLHRYKMADEFFMLVHLMKEHILEPDIHQYYLVLKMAAGVGNSMTAQFCFEHVIASDILTCPKSELYGYLIKAYSKDKTKDSKNASMVIHLFNEMIEKGHKPTDGIITNVIIEYLRAWDIEGANKVIVKYGEGVAELKNIIKRQFIGAYVARKEFTKAEELFDELKAEYTVTSLEYNEMLKICELTGDVKKANDLYQEMLEKGFVPNLYTGLHRIRTYLKVREVEPCVDILEDNYTTGGTPLHINIYVTVLRHVIQTGNVENVKKVIGLIEQHRYNNVHPTDLHNSLILVNIKAGNLEDASALLYNQPTGHIGNLNIEYNPYHKAARSAYIDGDVQYLENMIKFLKMNNMQFQSVDRFYLLALDKNDDIDGIQCFYHDRMEAGIDFNEKTVGLLDSIISNRGLSDFRVKV